MTPEEARALVPGIILYARWPAATDATGWWRARCVRPSEVGGAVVVFARATRDGNYTSKWEATLRWFGPEDLAPAARCWACAVPHPVVNGHILCSTPVAEPNDRLRWYVAGPSVHHLLMIAPDGRVFPRAHCGRRTPVGAAPYLNDGATGILCHRCRWALHALWEDAYSAAKAARTLKETA